MHSKRPRFQNFYRGHAPVQTHSRNSRFKFNACQWQGTFFPVLCLLQSFCHLLKTLLKTLYKDLQFGQNIFPSTCHMKYCIDLILGQAFFINENYLLSSPRFWMFCNGLGQAKCHGYLPKGQAGIHFFFKLCIKSTALGFIVFLVCLFISVQLLMLMILK